MKKSKKKATKIDVEWKYNRLNEKYDLMDENDRLCANPIGKTCAILKRYNSTNFYQNEKWGYLENVLYSIQDGIPINFDGDLNTSCYLIRIESIL